MGKISYDKVIKNKELQIYIRQGNDVLGALGYTDHSIAHVSKVAETAGRILKKLGYDDHLIELAKIAGLMHDIGNCVNRTDHSHSGALMAFYLLQKWNADPEDIAIIITAIGQHDEATGTAVDPVSAAVILADKCDVRRNRVRNPVINTFDKHDKVNYAAESSKLTIDTEKKTIILDIKLDESICTIMDYFEIFLQRMIMCKRAGEVLGLQFKAKVNGHKIC